MAYQLWDLESRNLIDEFDGRTEALEAARAYLTPDDTGVSVEVALVEYDDAEQPVRSIQGESLRVLAFGPHVGVTRRPA